MAKYILKIPLLFDAWHYELGADVPIWVARRAHKLGTDGHLTVRRTACVDGFDYARVGDWIVRSENDDYCVVPNEDFESIFQPATPEQIEDSRKAKQPTQKGS